MTTQHRPWGRTPSRVATLALALWLAAGCAGGSRRGVREVTLEGEVVDPQCYFTHGARGAAHRACALYCARGGQDLAFLNRAGQKVYPIIASGHGRNPNDSLLAVVGYPVVLMGRLYERNGRQALVVDRIRRLDGGAGKPAEAESVTVDPMPNGADSSVVRPGG